VEEVVSQQPCSNACVLSINSLIIGDCDDNGTSDDSSDDTYMVHFNVSATNPGANGTYTVNDGNTDYGPFTYGADQSITLSADGVDYTLTFVDSELDYCTVEEVVSQQPCSNACVLTISSLTIGDCDNNGTSDDSSDDTYAVLFNVSATNPGANSTYTVNDGNTDYGPFAYDSDQSISLPADGVDYTLTFKDSELDYCSMEEVVSQQPCSNAPCQLSVSQFKIGDCNNQGTPYITSDDTYKVTYQIMAIHPGANNLFYLKTDNQDYGPYAYSSIQDITLPANNKPYPMVFSDSERPNCKTTKIAKQAPCTEKNQNDLYIPNVFSPNGDQQNDYWEIYTSNDQITILSCRIYDRWGEMVFSITNSNRFQWDGRYKNQDLASGVYVYAIEYKTPDLDIVKVAAGDLTLVR